MNQSLHNDNDTEIPHKLIIATSYTWRFLLFVAALLVLYKIAVFLQELLLPFSLSILLSALLTPLVKLLHSWKLPRWLAALLSVIFFFFCLFLLLYIITTQVHDDWPGFSNLILIKVHDLQDWLVNGPFHVQQDDVANISVRFSDFIQNNSLSFFHAAQTGLLASVEVISEFFARIVLIFFCTIFLLYDGANIWGFITKLVPSKQRQKIRAAGKLGFGSLVAYVRATVVVAIVDAIGIYIGLAFTAVPLAAPLALLVFLGAFIPMVGAVVAGAVAVLIALITKGTVSALITLLIIIAVMQLESHVLQPFLLGKAVELHPLAVVIAITTGAITLHVWGALIAVPITAVLSTAIRYLNKEVPDHIEKQLEQELLN